MGLKLESDADKRRLQTCMDTCVGFELQELKLHLTQRCNLKCFMCSHWRKQHIGPDLPFSEIAKLLDSALQMGLKKLKLTGGEPLLRPDIFEVISYAKKKGIEVVLTTNGTLLDHAKAIKLLQNGLDHIIFSIDSGTASTHDQIRGVPGTFEKVFLAIDNMHEAATRINHCADMRIQINFVILKVNYQTLLELVEKAISHNVNKITLNQLLPNAPKALDKNSSEYNFLLENNLNKSEIEDYYDRIIPRILDYKEQGHIEVNAENLYLFGHSDLEKDCASRCFFVDKTLSQTYCFRPWYYATVKSTGDVVACNRVKSQKVYPIGNIMKQTIDVLWNSKKYVSFRTQCKPPRFPECRFCCYPVHLNNKRIMNQVYDYT